jgi:hypothetical protein
MGRMLCSKDRQKAEVEKQNTEKIGGFMKKVLVLVMVMALLFTGCTAVKGLLNSAPVDFLCAPTPAQQATAAAMLAALDAAQAAGAIFLPALAIAKASAVLRVIQAGGCFLVAELKAAFEVVDAANQEVAKMQMKMLKAAPPALPEYAPLRQLVK